MEKVVKNKTRDAAIEAQEMALSIDARFVLEFRRFRRISTLVCLIVEFLPSIQILVVRCDSWGSKLNISLFPFSTISWRSTLPERILKASGSGVGFFRGIRHRHFIRSRIYTIKRNLYNKEWCVKFWRL